MIFLINLFLFEINTLLYFQMLKKLHYSKIQQRKINTSKRHTISKVKLCSTLISVITVYMIYSKHLFKKKMK